MAFTFSVAGNTVNGNERVIYGTVTTDGTAGYVATGLGTIHRLVYSPKSQTTGVKFTINALDSGTATAGTLAITGCTSGDELYISCYGA